MRVLVLGGNGFIGQRIATQLAQAGWAVPVVASRRPAPSAALPGTEHRQLDTLNLDGLAAALKDVDAVVNCVAGDAAAIADGARLLAEAAALQARRPRIVHLSSMAVYGGAEGVLTEAAPHDAATSGWYGRAKSDAEAHLARYAQAGGAVVVFRPGCVHGPGSDQWVGRIGSLLRSGRLGDLGAAGDGWSNLVHVDDVAAAVLAGLRLDAGGTAPQVFNLAAPDSPRWNQYFTDLALAIGATPVRRLGGKRLQLDAKVGGPVLKIAELLGRRVGLPASKLPVAMSPSLLRLWSQQLRLDSTAALDVLRLKMRTYQQGLNDSAQWFSTRYPAAPR